MIAFEISCSHCGRELPQTVQAETLSEISPEHVRSQVEAQGWIVQVNGEHLDTYCTERCAK